ncbi:MAG TPA: hypothetical protein VG498_05885 [Terriglobales bacterium]|nr:hypothetical protein [Terriglobales bacterium]
MNPGQIALAIVCLLVSGAQAQSLGDVARQQKKAQHSGTVSNRVLTNDDLHSDSSSEPETTSGTNQKKPAKPKSTSDQQPQTTAGKISAEEFKEKIQKQKDEIAAIQERIDKLQSTINYVQNNRNIYTNAPEYNDVQKRKQQQIDQLNGILRERLNELKDLQEQARQAGYGSSVYN